MRISVGKSRKDLKWKVEDISWSDLCERLANTHRSSETVAEYKAMKPRQRDLKKDVGGFVGGVIEGGRRTSRNTKSRSLITLDADFAEEGMWENVTMLYDFAMCCYSTHSHLPKAPRLRFVIPLDREVDVDEYEPIARLVAKDFGIEQFDVTTYEASRLMYWPSTSKDGEFIFERQDGEFLSADETLARYKDWTNTIEWPLADREHTVHLKSAKQQGDPETKPGIVGLFCRTYNVETAMAEFLPDVYEACDEPNRYTYLPGTTSGGVVIYSNGQFAYSHHATDPAGGKLSNAFDLVRLHKFSDLDFEADPETPVNRLPSYLAMQEFCSGIEAVRQALVEEKLAAAKEDFRVDEWTELPTTGKDGNILTTQPNVEIILRNDPNIKGKMKMNEFTQRRVLVDSLPWRQCEDPNNGTPWSDRDDAGLRGYLQRVYDIRNVQVTEDALTVVASEEGFHPVRNYLKSLEWDGLPRVETLFIDWMGAEDDIYTRAVTKKWLTAAVARVMRPGCKFDNMIVLVGDQGVGKSLLAKKLGRHWFSDTFMTVQGKDGLEQLRGFWIIEMAELSAMRRSDAESVKHFISKQEDAYRQAYGRHLASYPRQCVFYGTTNETDFLKDRTGNRRFWPIAVRPTKKVFSMGEDVVDQVWAEAYELYKAGEPLWLGPELEKLALDRQEAFMEDNPKLGMIEDYLERPLPENWEKLNVGERKDYIQGYSQSNAPLTYRRDQVCVQEIMAELFNVNITTAPGYAVKEYHTLMRAVKGWVKVDSRRSTVYGKQTVYVREVD